MKMKGYAGKLLQVDLSKGTSHVQELDRPRAYRVIGGRGLGASILLEELTNSTIDPYDSDNILVVSAGPLTGTTAPSCTRFCVTTKSPLTGTITCSLAGGSFGPNLKAAGFDALIIRGRAERPVFLRVENGELSICSASHLWGLNSDETQAILRQAVGSNASSLCIGPAGENLVRFACIVSYARTAGRGGAGAVMGSKNLKAITVQGDAQVKIADENKFREAVRDVYADYRSNEDMMQSWRKHGTTSVIALSNELGILPTRNFQTGVFEGASGIDHEAFRKFVVKDTGCANCPLTCAKVTAVRDGPYAGATVEGPEYETLWSLGSQCGNSALEAIVAANMLCDKLGMDTISVGNIIGFTMECCERGLLKKEDLGGLELKFGRHEEMLTIIPKIAFRQGIGSLLAEGVKRTAEKIGHGAEVYAMHVKGLELAGYDPRGVKAHGLGYAVVSRGGCHERAYATQEMFGVPERVDRFTVKGKGRLTKNNEDWTAVIDSAVMCVFPPNSGLLTKSHFANLLSAATGFEYTVDDLMKAGERIVNMERIFNVTVGFRRSDDTLPRRLLKEPMPDGPACGHVFELDAMLDEYYEARGWDRETGIPSRQKLRELEVRESQSLT